MSASAAVSDVAIILAGVSSAGTLYYGWRRRVADAARAPFIAGETAIADAKAALEFRGRLIKELTESEADLKARLEQAVASARVQQDELARVQSRLSTVESENRDLTARAEAAEAAGRQSRVRLTQVEEQLETLQRKFNLGTEGY